MTQPRVLIVAGSDSGGGAGIQADIKTVTMMGGFAMTAITALTAQNTRGVDAVMTVSTDMVLDQIDAVLSDLGADAIKIGMIGSAATATALAQRLGELRVPIVFDPVMVATSGSVLADAPTVLAFERLMAVATLVTPNLPELEILYGRNLRGDEDVMDAALALHRRHGCAVLAKGGHAGGRKVTDLLVVRGNAFCHEANRIVTDHTHGTGCTLASAVATGLAMGQTIETAVAQGIIYVQEAIKAAPGFGHGHGPIGHTLGISPWQNIHRKVRR